MLPAHASTTTAGISARVTKGKTRRCALVVAMASGLSLAAISVSAETVQMPRPETAARVASSATLPNRGMTKAQVEQRFGAPQTKEGPTGEPPIFYWEYTDFTVYFESNYVIHAVNKHKSQLQK
jgi:hypothetical protein